MQLSHQAMGLDIKADAEFIKINKIKGRPLKDLISHKKKKKEVYNNSHPVITITMPISKATAVGWHFKVMDTHIRLQKI